MTANTYLNPPVHEVVLDVQLAAEVSEARIRAFKEPAQEGLDFEESSPLTTTELMMAVGRPGESFQQSSQRFSGWLLKNKKLDWVLQLRRDKYSFHAVRSSSWPSGPYVGWETVFSRFEKIHRVVRAVYGESQVIRLGLRYLNRIAVPDSEDAMSFFRLRVETPSLLRERYSFSLSQTWKSAEDFSDLNATVRLASIVIEDAAVARGNQGVLLDVDVFGLWSEPAFDYDEAPDWFVRAHETERKIFEACITEGLRNLFRRERHAS